MTRVTLSTVIVGSGEKSCYMYVQQDFISYEMIKDSLSRQLDHKKLMLPTFRLQALILKARSADLDKFLVIKLRALGNCGKIRSSDTT